MTAIRIHKMIDSETLTIPELKPLIGRTVQIVIDEPALPAGFCPGVGDWDDVLAATRTLEDYDYQAALDLNACDLRDAVEKTK